MKNTSLYDKEAEQNVLGALLLDNSVAYKAREIKEKLFYFEAHKAIFRAMKELLDKNKPIDIVLLRDLLEKQGLLEKIGLDYIVSLTTIVATTANIDYYIQILQDKVLIREIKEQAEELLKDIGSKNTAQIHNSVTLLKEILVDSSTTKDNYLDASEVEFEGVEHKSISTGYAKIDENMDGFRYGTLTVLSGKPSSGKSTIINAFLASAIDSGHKAFLYSGELPTEIVLDWFTKYVASEEDIIPYQTELGARYSAPSPNAIRKIRRWIKGKLFLYNEDAPADERSMCATIEHLYLKYGVRMFILDNLMTLALDAKDKYESQKELAKNLKNLARKYNLVIILVAHPKKTNNGDNVDMFDVSGASEIVNLCDYELFTQRIIDDEEGKDETYLLITKNRQTGKQKKRLQLHFDDIRKRLYSSPAELNRVYKYDINEQQSMEEIAPF